jgi:HK97 family phage prohead protease
MQHKAFNLAVTKAAEDDTRGFVISTLDEDREGDVLDPAGVVLDNYLRNPTVLWSHDYWGLPIGRARNVRPSTSAVMADIQFAPTEFADQVRLLVDTGFLKGVSVGFDPKAWQWRTTTSGDQGRKFTKWELLEISLCPVPTNPMALVSEAKSMGYRVGAIERAMNGKPEIITVNGLRVKLDYLEQLVREETRTAVERIRGKTR